MDNAHILPVICCRAKELLDIVEIQELNVELHSALVNIVSIMENSQDLLYENENKMLALLGTIFNECTKVQNYTNYEIQKEQDNFCYCCIDELSSMTALTKYTNTKDLLFAIAGFHNKNIKSTDLCQKYFKFVHSHTVLMVDAALCYMKVRYNVSNNLSDVDKKLAGILFNNAYHDLLPWFRKLTLWCKFHFVFYGKCLELDTGKKYFYNPENYMNHILKALIRKEHGHSVMEIFSIVLCDLDYNTFTRNYFWKFISNYKVCSDDEGCSSYNYNLLHYVLPAIIHAYPTKVVEIVETFSNGQPFFEELFLAALTIAVRKKLINFDWCLNDHVYYNLQVCQGWIAERTLLAIINEIADSKHIVICFILLRRFMSGATYQRLCSVRFLHLLEKFNAYLKLFVSKIARRKNNDYHVKSVISFHTFILEYTKARFRETEDSQKQYYYEIFQHTRQNLPDFFCNNPTKISEEQISLKTCAIYSVKHFLQTLRYCDKSNLTMEEIECYLQILLQYEQFHTIEHNLVIELRKYSHCSIHSFSSNVLAVTMTVYRKLIQANVRSDYCIKLDNIERIILGIIPKQSDTDPNIFVDMDAGFELAVIEGMKIIAHIINNESEEYNNEFSVVDYLRLCEHIMEYGPSKKLVFEISRLHRAALKEQSIKSTQFFINYVKDSISLITGSNVLVARRAMRRHPSITETIRNILIALVEYETHNDKILQTTLQNELLDYAKSSVSTDGMYFILVTEAQKVVFDTKEFPFRNIIRVEELIMHVLMKLDIASKWEVVTAIIQLLQALLSTISTHTDVLSFQRYFNLMVEITSFVPSRMITTLAAIYVLHILRFRDVQSALGSKLPMLQIQNTTMLSKVLYDCTICADVVPYEAVTNLTNDINTQTRLKLYNNQTCRAVTTLIEQLYKDCFGDEYSFC